MTSIWQSTDPLAEEYQWLSPYVFTGNNPINYIDPNGNDFFAANDASKNVILEAIRMTFGNTNGFSFNNNQLLFDKATFGNRDLTAEQQLLFNVLVNELINDRTIDITYNLDANFESAQTEGVSGSSFEDYLSINQKPKIVIRVGSSFAASLTGDPDDEDQDDPNQPFSRRHSVYLWHEVGHVLGWKKGQAYNRKTYTENNQSAINLENVFRRQIGIIQRNNATGSHAGKDKATQKKEKRKQIKTPRYNYD